MGNKWAINGQLMGNKWAIKEQQMSNKWANKWVIIGGLNDSKEVKLSCFTSDVEVTTRLPTSVLIVVAVTTKGQILRFSRREETNICTFERSFSNIRKRFWCFVVALILHCQKWLQYLYGYWAVCNIYTDTEQSAISIRILSSLQYLYE